MAMNMFTEPHEHRSETGPLVTQLIKSISGVSVAVLATFNVIANNWFDFTPSNKMDLSVAVLGAIVGALAYRAGRNSSKK
ncbi:hypothetical protein [Agrobacterium larrymoorei]|uniref:Uncharacterized protein n=1 Tax=Agrobacterium larrymoorei TaxID=160699 RepID=A0AAF0KCQ9_9HYPH|nr:hypothetical protein [Agrobacterium larrymoorei]WHA40078.1 hypothetical protein CFBP5477_009525 [Agrobacterium larrymoorei]